MIALGTGLNLGLNTDHLTVTAQKTNHDPGLARSQVAGVGDNIESTSQCNDLDGCGESGDVLSGQGGWVLPEETLISTDTDWWHIVEIVTRVDLECGFTVGDWLLAETHLDADIRLFEVSLFCQ